MHMPKNSFVWGIEKIDSRPPNSSPGTHAPEQDRLGMRAQRHETDRGGWEGGGITAAAVCQACRYSGYRRCCACMPTAAALLSHTFFFFPLIVPPTLVYPTARCGGLWCTFAHAEKFICMGNRKNRLTATKLISRHARTSGTSPPAYPRHHARQPRVHARWPGKTLG